MDKFFTIGTKRYKYDSKDEERIRQILNKYTSPSKILKESIDPETIRFLFDGLFWYVNGKLIDKIIDELKEFKELERTKR